MNEIKIFINEEFGEIRTVIIDGEPWFVGRDIAKALGYAKPEGAVATHCRHPLKRGIPHPQSPERVIEVLTIPEGDMYRLISKSKLKSAERFEEWVFDEVLPIIRKTGSYGEKKSTQEQITLLAQGTTELYERVDGLEQRFGKFEDSLPLFPEDADKIKNVLNKKVVEHLGGKESNAYRDKSLCRKVFIDAYRESKRNFEVNSYKSIKRNQKDKALQIIEEYKPPLFLAEQIDNANAQMNIKI